MTQIARQFRWQQKDALTMPTLNQEFDNIVNNWNAQDNGTQAWTDVVISGDISFQSVQGVWRGFNVKDYGAKGDGTTDDTTAIQNTINAAQNVYGGVVVFPTGTYVLTDQLTITHTVSLIGTSGTVPGPDSEYTTNAGAPNLLTGGVFLWQTTNNKNGLLIQQNPTDTYSIRVRMENLTWVGQISITGIGPGGTSGDGIQVDAASIGHNIQCFFDNVSIEYFRGYGLKLNEGYFSSTFRNMNISGNGLTGFYAVGTSQGEYTCHNLRCFGNGANGATEADGSGVYCQSGGQGISFVRLSCTSNYKAQTYIKGSGVTILDYQAESFNANNSSDRSLVIDTCSIVASGLYFSPQSAFLGKIIDFRTGTNSILTGIHFNTTVDPSGFHVSEDGSSGSNFIHYTTLNGTLVTSLQPSSRIGGGTGAWFAATATNDSAAAGQIGEYLVSSVVSGSAVSLTNGNWVDITSLTLTAGDWDVSGIVRVTNGTAVAMTYMDAAISQTSGNSSTGIIAGNNNAEGPPSTAAYDVTQIIPGYRQSVSTGTTIYLKANVGFSSGTPKGFGRISARRVR